MCGSSSSSPREVICRREAGPPSAGAEPAGLHAGLTPSDGGGNRRAGACPAGGRALAEHVQVMDAKAGNGYAPSVPSDDF